ncbi:conserved oligomeric Golgi complex subunit 6 [Biomphalaria pfeifferi]|uniref:Conserved oligomeric Golgi complex subunit 6 n=1 Tax=Biomphalaria pfeifferi TaxID=112525 RepID=A0AAD8BCF7_BIOPF|nr:conserved oligomeric Golgi complex subunit 6 [Biomphalaria pfeifferi]
MANRDEKDNNAQTAANPLSRKLNKILETRLDNDKEMLEALKALSIFFTENNLRSRRNLRSDIEKRSLAINEEFLSAFQAVKEQLDSVYSDVQAMNECCQDMTNRLKAAKAKTHHLISQTTSLHNESQKLQLREQVANAFLEKFQLKPDEIKILRGTRDGGLHADFFKALAKVKQIHSDCKFLLRTNHQTAGLEIMESMALHQESAYERLYRWTQNQCRQVTQDTPDVSYLLCQAVEALQDRPVLLKYSLDEFGKARRSAVVRGFIDALTRGGPGGTPRPIELHSHDPLRYVGDMLAWLHQSSASEKEYLQSLVKNCSANVIQLEEILGHITEGVCTPFKVRVEQVLVSEQDPVILYKLDNLLKFYHHTITQIISSEAALLTTVAEIQDLSHRMFFNSLTSHANRLLDKVELPPPDLGATSSLTQTLQLLRDVLACHDASVVRIDDKKQDYKQILACVIDPLLQMCSVSASRLNAVDMAAYMVNSIHLMNTTLSLYEYTDARLEMLNAQTEAHLDTLVSEQASYILNRVGLAQMYGSIQQHRPEHGPLSSISGLDEIAIKSAMNKFDSYLAQPDSLTLPQCSLILSSTVRASAKKRSVELVCQAYKQIYNAIIDPKNNYRDGQNIVPRTPEQVVHLLM